MEVCDDDFDPFQIIETLTLKQCSSVAHQVGRKWVLSELYGVTGWQFTFEGMKWLEGRSLKSQRRFNARSTIAVLKRDEKLIQLGFALARPAETFEKLARVCDVLAGCLRRDDIKGMTIVGEHLACSIRNAHQSVVEAERMVRALLSVSTSNPIHAWQREE